MEDYSNYDDEGMDGVFDNIRAAQARAAVARAQSVAAASARHMAATRAAAGHPTVADIASGGPQARAVARAQAAQRAAAGVATSSAPGRPQPQWVRLEASGAKMQILGQMPMRPDVGRILQGLTQADLLGVLKRPRAAAYFLNMALQAPTHELATYFAVLSANADVHVPGR